MTKKEFENKYLHKEVKLELKNDNYKYSGLLLRNEDYDKKHNTFRLGNYGCYCLELENGDVDNNTTFRFSHIKTIKLKYEE